MRAMDRILIVDDDRSIRELLSMHLEERGFGVVSAAVGYYASWVEQLPTGATMVVIASLFLLPGLVKISLRSSV